MHRAIVVRRPADEGEGRARTEVDPLGAAAQDALGGDTAEANPLLEAPFDPGQFDFGQAVLRPAGRRRSEASRPARSLPAAHQRCTGPPGGGGPFARTNGVWG